MTLVSGNGRRFLFLQGPHGPFFAPAGPRCCAPPGPRSGASASTRRRASSGPTAPATSPIPAPPEDWPATCRAPVRKPRHHRPGALRRHPPDPCPGDRAGPHPRPDRACLRGRLPAALLGDLRTRRRQRQFAADGACRRRDAGRPGQRRPGPARRRRPIGATCASTCSTARSTTASCCRGTAPTAASARIARSRSARSSGSTCGACC